MKTILLGILLISFCSCTSEYEERLSKAKELKNRINMIMEVANSTDQKILSKKIELLHNEITFHAKVSGNEELFFQQLETN
jgi:hypothetical protein